MLDERSEIQREIEKMKERLRTLEQRLRKASAGSMSKEERIRHIEAELKTKYPSANPDKELLSLVGSLPNPRVGYKGAVRRVVAERYAR